MGCCQICQASGGLTALVWLNGEVINATVCKTVIRGFESHFNLRRPKYKEGQWKLCAGCPYCGNSSSVRALAFQPKSGVRFPVSAQPLVAISKSKNIKTCAVYGVIEIAI